MTRISFANVVFNHTAILGVCNHKIPHVPDVLPVDFNLSAPGPATLYLLHTSGPETMHNPVTNEKYLLFADRVRVAKKHHDRAHTLFSILTGGNEPHVYVPDNGGTLPLMFFAPSNSDNPGIAVFIAPVVDGNTKNEVV